MANQPKKYKKFVATAATATLVASAIVPVASAKSFSDVPANNEFEPFIDALSDAGIINGYTDGTFKPGAKLTRGQVVKMLGRWVESNGETVPADWNSVQRFNDVPVNGKDEELVKYAALVKDAGVFTGSNGNLMAGNNITRQQMAKVLNGAFTAVNGVSLVDLADSIDNKLVTDLASAQQEFEGYIQALVDLQISTVSVFRPSENVTRAQFAKFLYNTINLDASVSASVKAVNATTVEVTFSEEVGNVDDYKFEIDGLDINNVAKKQSDAKTVVLTTAVQESGKEYTVTVNGEEVGTFTGVSSVIPTAISFVNSSIQAKNGEEVTVQAKVTVPDGQSKEGIPVTFNVYTGKNNDTAINPQIIGEATTNADGVATYKYTRYNGDTDFVDAYATGAPSKKATAKVYWNAPITISDITEGSALANNAKKVYQITGKKNTTVYVAFEENLNVTPDKGVTTAKVEGFTTYTLDSAGNKLTPITNGYPYEFTTGGKAVTEVILDANGKANLVVSGVNATVTPVVYEVTDAYQGSRDVNKSTNFAYSKTAKQVKGSTVTFQQTQILSLSVVAEGKANAATWKNGTEKGGRDYVATVKTATGAAAVGTPVRVVFDEKTSNNFGTLQVYKADGTLTTKTTSGDVVYFDGLTTDSKGEVKFTVTNSEANAYATPTVFIENGTKNGLDTADLQQVSEITYFSNVLPSDYTSKLVTTTTADTTKVVTTFGANDVARFAYQLSDQNGKPRAYATAPTNVTFQVTNTGASALTVTAAGVEYVLNPGQVGTYNAIIGTNNTETEIFVKSTGTSSATVIATPSTSGLALGQVSTNVTFASGATTTNFSVDKVDSKAGVATADVVTLTFTENVSVANVTVFAVANGGTVAALQADATNAKVIRATFVNPLVSGTANNTFKVSYAGKVYTFELQADGTFKQT